MQANCLIGVVPHGDIAGRPPVNLPLFLFRFCLSEDFRNLLLDFGQECHTLHGRMLLDGIGEDAKHDVGEVRMGVSSGLHPTLLRLFLRCLGQGLALLPVLETFPKRLHVGARGKGFGGQRQLHAFVARWQHGCALGRIAVEAGEREADEDDVVATLQQAVGDFQLGEVAHAKPRAPLISAIERVLTEQVNCRTLLQGAAFAFFFKYFFQL